MGTYRKIEVKTWGDDKFRALSEIPACGQGLWLYLLTGPHTNALPCAFRASRAAMAEELNWEMEAFDKAFQELFAKGMAKADFKARVVLIPNACRYTQPTNPNVLKAWGKSFEDLPDCDLKWEAYECVKACVSNMSEPFGKAFGKAFGNHSANGSSNGLSKGLPIHNTAQHSKVSSQNKSSQDDRVVLHPHARGRELGHKGGLA